MNLFESLKLIHVSCALLSIGGFALRGYWRIRESPLSRRRLTRVLPHLVDTLLLGTAVGMLIIWRVSPLALPWVTAKLCALLVYIGLGMVALRFAQGKAPQLTAYILALLVAAYIVSVAWTKTALGALQAVVP